MRLESAEAAEAGRGPNGSLSSNQVSFKTKTQMTSYYHRVYVPSIAGVRVPLIQTSLRPSYGYKPVHVRVDAQPVPPQTLPEGVPSALNTVVPTLVNTRAGVTSSYAQVDANMAGMASSGVTRPKSVTRSNAQKGKAHFCKVCGAPRKGHPRGKCNEPALSAQHES